MQTITLTYQGPEFPAQGFLFYELCLRFMVDNEHQKELAKIRHRLRHFWYSGDSNTFRGFVKHLQLDQQKGIVRVICQ